MYKYIINPKTNKKVLVTGKIGSKILRNYLTLVGGSTKTRSYKKNIKTLHQNLPIEFEKWLKKIKRPGIHSMPVPFELNDALFYVCRYINFPVADFKLNLFKCPNFKTKEIFQKKGLLTKWLNLLEKYCMQNNCGIVIDEFSNDDFFIHLVKKRKWIPWQPMLNIFFSKKLFNNYIKAGTIEERAEIYMNKLYSSSAIFVPNNKYKYKQKINKYYLTQPCINRNKKICERDSKCKIMEFENKKICLNKKYKSNTNILLRYIIAYNKPYRKDLRKKIEEGHITTKKDIVKYIKHHRVSEKNRV